MHHGADTQGVCLGLALMQVSYSLVYRPPLTRVFDAKETVMWRKGWTDPNTGEPVGASGLPRLFLM
jgi:hypothetical protein